MGSTLKAALDEIGYVALEKAEEERKQIILEAEKEKKQIILEAEEKIAKITLKADKAEQRRVQAEQEKAQAEQEKAQLARQTEQEKAQLYKKQKEDAIDMLRMGTPISSVMKWTTLQEAEIMRLKEEIGFLSESSNS